MAKAPLATSSFAWRKPGQVRMGVQVDSAIEMIIKSPRAVEEMSLRKWSLFASTQFHAVIFDHGVPNKYQPHRLPATLAGTFPVLVGSANRKLFLIDGAHRVAKALHDRLSTIHAVVLTEAETRGCIISGREKSFNEIFGSPAET